LRSLFALLAAFALVSFVAGCQNTVGSAQLKVGDCVDETLVSDEENGQSRAYSPVECATAHDDEVFYVFDYPNTSSFPGYEQIGSLQQSTCQSQFQVYVGVTWDKSHYTISYASPDEAAWNSGDHAIHCLLSDASDAKTTGSAKGTKK
jgi:hypothetical protein